MTHTRVVQAPASPTRISLHVPRRADAADVDTNRIGAFLLVERLGATDNGDLILGYDDVLRRHVWIHRQTPGTPPVGTARHQIARPGRLRWLAGRRTPDETWGAYDAPAGVPFTLLAGKAQPWSLVRFLLYDVAVEAREALNAHEHLIFDLDRVWVTQRGTAVVLDFTVPGGPARALSPKDSERVPVNWLHVKSVIRKMALLAITGDSQATTVAAAVSVAAVPLRAYNFLIALDGVANVSALIDALRGLLHLPAMITHQRRLVHLASIVAVPAAAVAYSLVSSPQQNSFDVSKLTAPLAGSLLVLALPALYSAAVFHGGLVFRLLGIVVGTPNGPEASRPLALLRAAVGWLPALAFVTGVLSDQGWLAGVALAVMASGLVSAALTPSQGLQDRLLGTRLIRR